jgi:predicted nuclease of restriction endonuclease-like RecB superfamily
MGVGEMMTEIIKAADFKPTKPHKYGAKACVVDNIHFPSRREANRYAELKLLLRAGNISNLEIDAQTPIVYEIEVNGIHVTNYRPDFRYYDNDSRRMVICDAKGFRTDVYRLKKKLVRACFGIVIEET